jgi:hypothetical protein
MNFKKIFGMCILAIILLPVISFAQDELSKETTISYNLDGVFSGGGGNY